MNRRAALLALSVLGAAAPLAAGHGASVTQETNVGPYHVIFYTYDAITAGEYVRLSWNVTEASTQQRVQVDNPEVEVAWKDTSGKVVNDTTSPLQERLAGFLFNDFRTGPEGSVTYTLPLPDGSHAQFSQQVYPASTGLPGQSTPGPGLLAALGAGALAALAARRRA